MSSIILFKFTINSKKKLVNKIFFGDKLSIIGINGLNNL